MATQSAPLVTIVSILPVGSVPTPSWLVGDAGDAIALSCGHVTHTDRARVGGRVLCYDCKQGVAKNGVVVHG